jgi:molybdopterin-guanine dinucleotide biosynthesis protein B
VKIFGLVGWSGSGKTTLVAKLLPELIGRGFLVSTMKHTHHNFDIDKKGKDSYLHRISGATEVMITGARRWAILHENRDVPEPSIDDLLARMEDVDLVLIEGFKSHSHQKMEVFRSSVGKPLLAVDDPGIVAVASDAAAADLPQLEGKELALIDLEDVKAIADFIVGHTGLKARCRDGAA